MYAFVKQEISKDTSTPGTCGECNLFEVAITHIVFCLKIHTFLIQFYIFCLFLQMVRYERSSLSGKDDLEIEGNSLDNKSSEKVLDIETENANHVKFHMPSRKVHKLWKDRQLLEKILIVICILLLIAVLILSILLIHIWVKGKENQICSVYGIAYSK